MMENFVGTGVALITPFKEDLSIDIAALQRTVDYCIDGGVSYLVLLGTTAETATLSDVEKQLVIDTIVKVNAGRLPLVLGIGGNNTAAVVNEVKRRDLSEFEGILSVSPYYNRPTQEGIYQHFKAIAETSPLPIIMYNVPARTGSNMLPETTLRLANDFSNIVAIKEASADLVQIGKIIKDKPDNFLVLSGDDITTLPTILTGGDGVISVIGQGVPHQFCEMVRLALEGNVKESNTLHYELFELMQLAFEEGNPAGIKAILELKGLLTKSVRLPLVKASNDLTGRIQAALNKLNASVKV